MNKEKVLEILEDKGFPITGRHHTAININNSGTLNGEKLEKEKRLYLKSLTYHLVDELIKMNKHYPHGDISEVELFADFVIFKRSDIEYFKKEVESLWEYKNIMNNE